MKAQGLKSRGVKWSYLLNVKDTYLEYLRNILVRNVIAYDNLTVFQNKKFKAMYFKSNGAWKKTLLLSGGTCKEKAITTAKYVFCIGCILSVCKLGFSSFRNFVSFVQTAKTPTSHQLPSIWCQWSKSAFTILLQRLVNFQIFHWQVSHLVSDSLLLLGGQ